MKHTYAIAFLALTTFACAETEDDTSTSTSELSGAKDKGSVKDDKGSVKDDKGSVKDDGADSQGATYVAVSCKDGACVCVAGAAKGKSCDGKLEKGPTACNELCATPVADETSKPDAKPTKPDANPTKPGSEKDKQDAGAGEPTGGNVAVQCTNGVCKCVAGPKTGTVCDGANVSAPTACKVICVY